MPLTSATKPWYESKTLWFNVVGGIGEITMLLTHLWPPSTAPYLMTVNIVANVILRKLTNTAITA